MQKNDVVKAPFTDTQVEALNAWQKKGWLPSFTCGRDGHSDTALVATNVGWHCPTEGCDWEQNWAHPFMADEAKHPSHPFPDLAKT